MVDTKDEKNEAETPTLNPARELPDNSLETVETFLFSTLFGGLISAIGFYTVWQYFLAVENVDMVIGAQKVTMSNVSTMLLTAAIPGALIGLFFGAYWLMKNGKIARLEMENSILRVLREKTTSKNYGKRVQELEKELSTRQHDLKKVRDELIAEKNKLEQKLAGAEAQIVNDDATLGTYEEVVEGDLDYEPPVEYPHNDELEGASGVIVNMDKIKEPT